MKEDTFDFERFKEEAAERLRNGEDLSGKDGILTPLIKQIIEASLEGEIESHMRNEPAANRRNGKGSKKVKTGYGSIDLETPRDRNGSFEPMLVKKRQTSLGKGLDDKIIALYGLGMSYRDISSHMEELYGIELSEASLSSITDKIIPVVQEWQSRPLESVYPIVWMDAIHFKVREDGRVISKAVYCILGVNQQGYKDLLGLYISEVESAKFWLGVLNDLQYRGVEDIFVACIDNLTGFKEAITTVFPATAVQLCIVHQIRNSMKYIASKDEKEFIRDLKKVYKAVSKDKAEHHLLELEEKWDKKYAAVIRSWNNNWEELSHYFIYPDHIRRIIYTTNIIENFHAQLRKVTKTKRVFHSDMALFKLLYLVQENISKKWTQPMANWKSALSQFSITFEGRLKTGLKA